MSVRQRVMAAVLGLVLLGLVAGYAMLPAVGGYETRAMLDELSVSSESVLLMPCQLKLGGEANDPDDLDIDTAQAITLNDEQRAQLSDILDRNRWLFMGRLTKPRCWEPHHVIVFRHSDGGHLALQLSLACGRYKAGGFSPKPLPAMWHWRLKRWIRDVEADAQAASE